MCKHSQKFKLIKLIPLEILYRLSDLFGVDVAEFFEEDEKNVKENLICAFRTDGIAEKRFRNHCTI